MPKAVHQTALDSVEELQRPIAGAQLRATQISGRGFRGSLRIADLNGATLSYGTVDGDFLLEGALSEDNVVLGLLLSSTCPITNWSTEVNVGDLGFFPAGAPQTALYRGASEYLTVALTEERLGMFADENEFRLGRAQIHREGIIPDGRHVLAIGRSLSRWLRERPDRFEHDGFTAEIRDQFLVTYLSRLDPDGAGPRRDPVKNRRIVNRVIDFTQASLGKGLEIEGICAELGVPRRTLHRAFIDVTGLPPAKFIRLYRLNETRRRILQRTASVTEAASQCGFSELGKFAGYYRRLFGEVPSATLASVQSAIRPYCVRAAICVGR